MSVSDAMAIFRRSILWMLPVVLLPVGALMVMQYRFLRSFQEKSVMAERNWMRNSVEYAASEIENRYRSDAQAALTLSDWSLKNVRSIGEHVRSHSVPGARTFFAMRFRDTMYETGFFDPHGVEKMPTEGELEAVKMATVAWHVAHKWGRLVPQPAISVDERDPHHRILLRPVTDASMHVIGAMGVILDEELSQRAMTAIGTKALRKQYHSDTISLRVADRFPKSVSGGSQYVMQPLSFVFTGWKAGLRDMCASPEDIAAAQFRINSMWTGGAFIILLGAVGLGIGAVARQSRLSQMKSDFVSNVSHELRTPLSSIRVFGEYMRLGRVTREDKIREYGEYIEAESRRLTQLINNILDFSKIESAEKKYHFAETDIVELVQHTMAGLEAPLRDQGVAITFTSTGGRPPLLALDKDAMAQVLANLLDNAVKYSGTRKAIDVSVVTQPEAVRISVRDHGIGIPPAEHKKIFEKFYRVSSGLVHDVKGSGLGLSIVQHVVCAHQGRVEVESAPGDGSQFTIVLPLQASAHVALTRTEFA